MRAVVIVVIVMEGIVGKGTSAGVAGDVGGLVVDEERRRMTMTAAVLVRSL